MTDDQFIVLSYVVGIYALWFTFMIVKLFADAGSSDIYKFSKRRRASDQS